MINNQTYDLFKHMADEHGITLLESEMYDIVYLCKDIEMDYGENEIPLISFKQALMYECGASWIGSFIWFQWGQKLLAKKHYKKALKKWKVYREFNEVVKQMERDGIT